MKMVLLMAVVAICSLLPASAMAAEERQDRREERGRSDERQDKRDCRQEEGAVGKDKRDCKQEEVRDGVRGNRGPDDESDDG